MARPASVDEYIAKFPAPVQRVLKQVRSTFRQALPDAEEVISYSIPAYKVEGRVATSAYLGDAWLVKLDVAGLGQLQLVVPTWRGIQPQPGDQLRVGWDPDASVVVTDDVGG